MVHLLYRFVVLDGNEKMCRLICNAEKTKVHASLGQPNTIYEQCIRDPVRGNKSIRASKTCQQHSKGMD